MFLFLKRSGFSCLSNFNIKTLATKAFFLLCFSLFAIDFVPAQCPVKNTGLAISWSVSQGSSSDIAIITVSSAPATLARFAEIDFNLGIQLAGGATVSADFSGGWIFHSAGATAAEINDEATGIHVSFQRPACNYASGSGAICVITLRNNGTPLNLTSLIDGGDGIVLLDDTF